MADAASARLLADCRALSQRRRLDDAQLRECEQLLLQIQSVGNGGGGEDKLRELRGRVHALLDAELVAVIDGVRVLRNEQQREKFGNAELAAVAVGGALGALNAWFRPATPATTAATDAAASKASAVTSLWASAYDAAAASLNVVQQRRQVEHMRVTHLSGDPASSEHVLLCINGFMTQSDDPSKNWSAWCHDRALGGEAATAVYAVEWEAGDATVWSEFVSHVNDKLVGAPAAAVLTHFTGNPWHKAQAKAEHVGVLLAHVLAQQPALLQGRKLTLLGHSLGGAVIYSAFQELARLRADHQNGASEPPAVANAVSFAGAFLPTADGLNSISQGLATGGKFLNVFSSRDSVLSTLFWAIHRPGNNDPVAAGCQAIPTPESGATPVINIDVSDLVPPSVENHFGHSYRERMASILARVLPHLH